MSSYKVAIKMSTKYLYITYSPTLNYYYFTSAKSISTVFISMTAALDAIYQLYNKASVYATPVTYYPIDNLVIIKKLEKESKNAKQEVNHYSFHDDYEHYD